MSDTIISSNKDRRIHNYLQDPEINLDYIFFNHISINQDTKCWNWIGSKILSGYGYLKIDSKYFCYSHRLSYLIFKGLIPLKYQIDHLCKNKSCCNPEHLEAVSPHENKVRSGFLSRNYKRLSHEYFRKEIEQQDQEYKDNLIKNSKRSYHKKIANDSVITRAFRNTFDSTKHYLL